MKTCFKCGQQKEIDEFYKHCRMADGHLGKCKECTKKDVLKHRKKNIERIRAYDRERGKLPHRIANNRRISLRARKRNPLAYAAKILLNNALRSKKLKKPNRCTICNRMTRIYGHHNDYLKPLDVIWVCQVCHKQLHKQIKCAV